MPRVRRGRIARRRRVPQLRICPGRREAIPLEGTPPPGVAHGAGHFSCGLEARPAVAAGADRHLVGLGGGRFRAARNRAPRCQPPEAEGSPPHPVLSVSRFMSLPSSRLRLRPGSGPDHLLRAAGPGARERATLRGLPAGPLQAGDRRL